jgi:acyl-CoA synthetase (AMP-forming)/AMP-acid ligase II
MPIISRLAKFYLQKIRGLILPRDIINYSVNKHHEKIAVIDQERQITYGELYKRSMKLANAIMGLGLNKDDKLGVLLYNCQEYFEIRIAAYFTGIVLVPIIWDMALEDVIFILNDCDVKCLIYHSEILGDNLEKVKQKTAVKNYVPAPYDDLLLDINFDEPKVDIKSSDLASINFSSGSTGRPKGVMLTHGTWANSFYNYLLNSPETRTHKMVFMHFLSLSTAGGTSFLPTFVLGAKNILVKKIDPAHAIRLIKKYGVNTFFASPSLFIDFLDYCKNENKKPDLFRIIAGTEAMPKSKFKEAIDYFGSVIQRGYGMVEVLPPLTLLSPCDMKLASVGRALTGVEIKAVDKDGDELAPDKIGRIVIKSSTISKGYWQQPELNAKAYRGGAFFSNDLGWKDEEGYWYVLGREEDIIKEDCGKKCFASQIEDVLHEHPAVLLACVFKGEKGLIVASVSLRRGWQNVTTWDLRKFCEDRLVRNGFPMPDIFIVLPNMPMRATGKIDRKKIRESK